MLDVLYQQEIIELSRKSRARGRLDAPDASARADNPLCGDRATIDLALDKGRITAFGHLSPRLRALRSRRRNHRRERPWSGGSRRWRRLSV